eukprot:1298475-Rhodomonas_salina.1
MSGSRGRTGRLARRAPWASIREWSDLPRVCLAPSGNIRRCLEQTVLSRAWRARTTPTRGQVAATSQIVFATR